jgi:L-ascorbate metabolism protein UlaG (beta-lactamase superfamily)
MLNLAIVFAMGLLASTLVTTPALACYPCGQIGVEYLGWSEFLLTSPRGVTILTDPIGDPGSRNASPRATNVDHADLILISELDDVTNVTNTLNIARTTGARIFAPPSVVSALKQTGTLADNAIMAGNPGDRFGLRGLTIRMVSASPTTGTWRVAQSVGFVITFEDGQSMYFAGPTTAIDDQAILAQKYQPTVAFLDMSPYRDPRDIALQAALLEQGNPNLRTIVPTRQPVDLPDDATATPTTVQQELNNLGLNNLVLASIAPGQPLDTAAAAS